ncbi:LAQU0S02e08284g1_1 [Lachancea quebecensis]|uniref:LAQU0S02e08284g1_1 n=1 Tax=Lachancea quebecensis TaxID=1654605 RepID=A0A0P1KMU8_9SACH|nr:LAQU0S02e08284g1_1 [Lachancea quebecensis]
MDKEQQKRDLHNQFVAELREQDRWLPINNVGRLMKNTLPASAKVSKDAKECMQECVSEFISFVTSEANDRCTTDKRKTINGEDILISLNALGFENYAEVLKIYLAKYRQQQALKNQMSYMRRDGESEDLESGSQDEDPASTSAGHETSKDERVMETAPSNDIGLSEGASKDDTHFDQDSQLYL